MTKRTKNKPLLILCKSSLFSIVFLSGAAYSQEQTVTAFSNMELQSLQNKILSAYLARDPLVRGNFSEWKGSPDLKIWLQNNVETDLGAGAVPIANSNAYRSFIIKQVPEDIWASVTNGQVFSVFEMVPADALDAMGFPKVSDEPQVYISFYEYCEICAPPGVEVPGVRPLPPGCYMTPWGIKCLDLSKD